MFENWFNAAMALKQLDGVEKRFQDSRKRCQEIFAALNKVDGIKISHVAEGSNIYSLELGKGINARKFRDNLYNDYKIAMRQPDEKNNVNLSVNETILFQSTEYVINAFTKSL